MKQVSLLIALCALLSMSASAQTTTVDKKEKRITITTTKVDENGKAVTETWIAEGDQPEQILEKMVVTPEVLEKVNFDKAVKEENEERLFLIRHAGDDTVIEGKLSDLGELNHDGDKMEKIIIVTDDNGKSEQKVIIHGAPAYAKIWSRGGDERNKSNCAALGVYVNYDSAEGSVITSLIENGGAKDAGLQAGDVINKIDQYEITDFPSLHEALSHYVSGDVVVVRFVRNDKNQKVKVELKDWAQLPGHEWRARTDCGHPAEAEVIVDAAQGPVEGPTGTPNIQPLQLQDAQIFPNPTDGVFALSFKTEPGPLAISITDVNGKVVYHENNDNTSGTYNREIDLKGAPQGNYIISVNQSGKIFTQQISKQ